MVVLGGGAVSYERGTPVAPRFGGAGGFEQIVKHGRCEAQILVSLSLRLKDLLGPVTRVKNKKVRRGERVRRRPWGCIHGARVATYNPHALQMHEK